MRHPQDAPPIPRISYPQDAPPILGCIFPRMVAAILRIRPSQDASDHPRMGRPICRCFALPEKQLDDDRIFTRYFIPVKIKPNSDSLQPTMTTTAHAHTLLMDVRKVLIGEERFYGFVNALRD